MNICAISNYSVWSHSVFICHPHTPIYLTPTILNSKWNLAGNPVKRGIWGDLKNYVVQGEELDDIVRAALKPPFACIKLTIIDIHTQNSQ